MDSLADRLAAAVERTTTVGQSVVTLVQQLAAQLRETSSGATDLAQLQDRLTTMATQLEASTQAVADAVAANTVAEDETPEEPVPTASA